MRHAVSKTIVGHRSGLNGVQGKPGWLGLPVRAKFAQAVAIFFASACASGPLPVPCAQRFVLSKQKASSAVCHAPASSSIGDCHVKYHVNTGAAFCSVLHRGHARHVVAHGEAVQPAAAAHVRQRPDALLRMRLLQRRDQRRGLGLAVVLRQGGKPLRLRWPRRHAIAFFADRADQHRHVLRNLRRTVEEGRAS